MIERETLPLVGSCVATIHKLAEKSSRLFGDSVR